MTDAAAGRAPARRRSCDLVVLGGGVAGLAAAWRAASRGLSVSLLERSDRLGGTAGSFPVAGLTVDHGSHRLDPAGPAAVLADLRDLLGPDLQLRRVNSRLRVADRWVRLPVRPGDVVRRLPRGLALGIARDALSAPLRRPHEDTYAAVLRAGLGPTAYDAVYAPYARKLWGLPGERISAEQARRGVAAKTPREVAVRTPRAASRTYLYPRRGFGQVVDALTEAASAAGAELRLQAEVAAVRAGEDAVTVTTQDGDVTTARYAFSTLPLPVLARLGRPAPSLADMESAARLRYRALLLVYVVHAGGRWMPYDAHHVPTPDTPVSRLSEPANYRDSADDPPELSVLCAEIPCAMTDEVWGLSDEALGDVVDEALARTGLPPVRRTHVESRRLGHAYPIYKAGFERDLAGVDAWARMLRRVVTFGRQGLFAHDSAHGAAQMAYDAVDALREDGRFDRYAWTAARERFTGHVTGE